MRIIKKLSPKTNLQEISYYLENYLDQIAIYEHSSVESKLLTTLLNEIKELAENEVGSQYLIVYSELKYEKFKQINQIDIFDNYEPIYNRIIQQLQVIGVIEPLVLAG
jgi:hypothetical protein